MPATVLPFVNRAIPKMSPSVCRSCKPECQRCHLRLNASVQGLEDNTRRYRKSPLMVDAFPVCLPEVRALRGPRAAGFANLLNGVVHDGVDLDVYIRDGILTGSECPRGQGPGRTARISHFQRPLLCKSPTSGSVSCVTCRQSGAQDGLRGSHIFRGHCFASLRPRAVCRVLLVGSPERRRIARISHFQIRAVCRCFPVCTPGVRVHSVPSPGRTARNSQFLHRRSRTSCSVS